MQALEHRRGDVVLDPQDINAWRILMRYLAPLLILLFLLSSTAYAEPELDMEKVIKRAERIIAVCQHGIQKKRDEGQKAVMSRRTELKVKQVKRLIHEVNILDSTDPATIIHKKNSRTYSAIYKGEKRLRKIQTTLLQINKVSNNLSSYESHLHYCKSFSSELLKDLDGDKIPDAYDTDMDNDGAINSWDQYPAHPEASYLDSDNDSMPDHLQMQDEERKDIQKIFFEETGYLLIDGIKQFSKEEMEFLLKVFRNYSDLLNGLTDSLRTIQRAGRCTRDNESYMLASVKPSYLLMTLCEELFNPKYTIKKRATIRRAKKRIRGNKENKAKKRNTGERREIDLAQVILHEMGHVIHHHDILKAQEESKDSGEIVDFILGNGWKFGMDFETGFPSFQKCSDFENCKALTRYSNKDGKEFWAEIWSATVLLSEPWLGRSTPLSSNELLTNSRMYCSGDQSKLQGFCMNQQSLNYDLFQDASALLEMIKDPDWRSVATYDPEKPIYLFNWGNIDSDLFEY